MYINNLGHMTKTAAMPIYGKNPSKIFFSETNRLILMSASLPYTYLIAIYLCYPFKIWTPLPVLGRDDQNRYGVCVNSHRKPEVHEIFVSELN